MKINFRWGKTIENSVIQKESSNSLIIYNEDDGGLVGFITPSEDARPLYNSYINYLISDDINIPENTIIKIDSKKWEDYRKYFMNKYPDFAQADTRAHELFLESFRCFTCGDSFDKKDESKNIQEKRNNILSEIKEEYFPYMKFINFLPKESVEIEFEGGGITFYADSENGETFRINIKPFSYLSGKKKRVMILQKFKNFSESLNYDNDKNFGLLNKKEVLCEHDEEFKEGLFEDMIDSTSGLSDIDIERIIRAYSDSKQYI